MSNTLNTEELERIYDRLAEAVDRAGPGNEALFLSKLCLVLADRLGDEALVRECIDICARDIK